MSFQANVLVYCPQGISGTPMLSTLVQIICDPYYRTFDGLQVLLHKEWSYYQHDFCLKGLVFVDKSMHGSIKEQIEEQGLMDTIGTWFGKAKQDRTSIFTQGHETKIDPIFILLLDALA